jgi:hypothetical protein
VWRRQELWGYLSLSDFLALESVCHNLRAAAAHGSYFKHAVLARYERDDDEEEEDDGGGG